MGQSGVSEKVPTEAMTKFALDTATRWEAP
jgi:hypothetical protein